MIDAGVRKNIANIHLRDVTLRDGVQPLEEPVDPVFRAIIAALTLAAGMPEVEVGGFGKLPQHQGVEEVISLLKPEDRKKLSGYCPNQRGVQRAVDAGLTRFNLHTATTDGYTMPLLGVNAQEARAKLSDAAKAVRRVRRGVATAYLSGVDQDPNGSVEPKAVADVTKFALDEGIARVYASDTTGQATEDSMDAWLSAMLEAAGGDTERIGLHLHNRSERAVGLAVLAATDYGITHFDGALTGLGRCPAEQGLNGNAPTEQLVYAFEDQKLTTGVSHEGIDLAARAVGVLIPH